MTNLAGMYPFELLAFSIPIANQMVKVRSVYTRSGETGQKLPLLRRLRQEDCEFGHPKQLVKPLPQNKNEKWMDNTAER